MKTRHSSSASGASPAPPRASVARNAPAFGRPLRWFAKTLVVASWIDSSALAQVGASYCGPAVANSTGAPAVISGSGSTDVSANNLLLASSSLPHNAAAFFLCSRTQGFVSNPGGSTGNICLGNPIGRVVGGVIANSGTTGIVNVAANLLAMPQPSGAAVVQTGETWNFQCWYRDAVGGGGATSNFSDGLEVLFTGGGGTPAPAMVPIPAGWFLMGSNAPNGFPYYGPIGPQHHVSISYAFWMGRYEVTLEEYQALMGAHSPTYPGAMQPVVIVSWHMARAYCAALTALQAGTIPPGFEYRLPTEAEWEYACRAGSTTEFHYGAELFCNQARIRYSYHSIPPASCVNFFGTTSVGSYTPNAFGLFDMHGNVSEWCLDSFAPYPSVAVTDPFVTGGSTRIHRGGDWSSVSDECRSAYRDSLVPQGGNGHIGFRVVLAPVLAP